MSYLCNIMYMISRIHVPYQIIMVAIATMTLPLTHVRQLQLLFGEFDLPFFIAHDKFN